MRILLPAIILALACGAQPEEPDAADLGSSAERPLYAQDGAIVWGPGDGIDVPSTDRELGQASQPLIFAPAGATNPGIKPGNYQTCIQGDQNQNCVIPDEKDLIWYLYDGSSAQKTAVRAQVTEWYLDMVALGLEVCPQNGCWQFREATSLDDPELNLVIAIGQSASGFCPGTASQTRSLICWGGETTGVPKDSNSGLAGTYHRFADHIVPVATIDYAQIQGLALTPAQKVNRLRQATRAILLGFGGKGLMIIGNNRCNNTNLLAPDAVCSASASEACFFNGFGGEGEEMLFIGGANCGT